MFGETRETDRFVLVLEADVELRAMVATVLSARGFRVLEADDGDAGFSLLLTESPELVIVGALLPDMSGVEWIERIRESDATTTIVLLSSFSRELDRFEQLTQDLKVSMVAYTPIEPLTFAETIVELLDSSSRPAPSIHPRPSSRPPEPTDIVRAQMAELREDYARELPRKLDELEVGIHAAEGHPDNTQSASSAAHRLRGTAGAYGYKLVGQLAGQIEDLLLEYEANPLRARRGLWDEAKRILVDARLASHHQEPASTTHEHTAGTILFVNDDAEVRRIGMTLIRRQLLNVCVARSVPEALNKASTIELAAAIVDVDLAQGSAFDLCRQLRELPKKENIPLLLLSSESSVETRVAATHAGASLVVEKPIRESSFEQAIQQVVDEASARRRRILIVEDDPDFARHAELLLRSRGIETEWLASAERLSGTLEAFRPDLLLLDIDLPGVTGLDMCRSLRTSLDWQTLPILMITADIDDYTRIEAFRAGANDFVSKPVLEEEFHARIEMQLTHARLLQERSERDPLSGLQLRRPFLKALDQRLSEAVRHDRSLALAVIDVDHFKAINDQHGHMQGDAVLARLGQLLRQRFRSEDLRCRWGGEEFVVALPGQKADLLQRALERVLAEFSTIEFESGSGEPFSTTASAGVASYPEDGNRVVALIQRADRRMYRAKRQGRNQVIGREEGRAGTDSLIPLPKEHRL